MQTSVPSRQHCKYGVFVFTGHYLIEKFLREVIDCYSSEELVYKPLKNRHELAFWG